MEFAEELKKEYETIFSVCEKRPEWAEKLKVDARVIHPSVPFIGKNYNETRLLLYASAENLAYYTKTSENTILDDDSTAIDRHRLSFEKKNNDFFPNIHIAPISNGALILVTAYILKMLKPGISYKDPRDFIEKIAVGNFGKFSIKNSGKNKDYANDISKLADSLNYVENDLRVLNPEYLIIPKAIYGHKKIEDLILNFCPKCRVIPIYQINARVINCHIAKKYEKKNENDIGFLANWHKSLKGSLGKKTKENFYAVYSYLEELLK